MSERARFIEPPKSTRQQGKADPLRQFNVIGRRFAPQDDIYHYVLTISWWQFFGLAGFGFLLLNAGFTLLYLLVPGSVTNVREGSFEDLFYFSVQTMATIGYGVMSPANRYAHLLVVLQALVGIFSVALITGITYSKFARPSARVLFTKNIVVGNRDGVPHMMFRMANWRHNQVAEAQLRVVLLVEERTREGEVMRRPVEVKLVREKTPLFALTWTAMHVIDEHSPFFGPHALSRLRALKAQIFLTLQGMDETIAQNIQARFGYTLEDIVWNARFADVITTLPDGTRQIDYTYFHETVPMPDDSLVAVPQ